MNADDQGNGGPNEWRRAADNEPTIARLGVWDAASLIVGIVVGVSIFKVSPLVFSNVDGPWQGLAVWAAGGVLALVGALCYAELASTYPRDGGDYVYLTRAFSPFTGFLFGWAHLTAILTGSIGAMAFVFGDYAVRVWGDAFSIGVETATVLFAIAAVVVLTLVNVAGVAAGKSTQNVLTAAKVLGLAAILAAGFLYGGESSFVATTPTGGGGLGLAMIFVLYAYGGWNDSAFVAAEVRNPERNVPRALILGVGGITVLYLLVNGAYLWGLGFEGLRGSTTPAADVLVPWLGASGSNAISVAVMISALGAVNGLIFTGSRVYAVMGADHTVLALLGRWHPRWGTPVGSLVAQAVVTLTMILVVGTRFGREGVDAVLEWFARDPLLWDNYGGGFDTLVAATAPVFWAFFLLTGLSVFALRERDHGIARPFRVPFYPFTPFVFCLTCTWMLYSSATFAGWLVVVGVAPLLPALPIYLLSRRRTASS